MVDDQGTRMAERPVVVVTHRSEADSRAIGKEARAAVPRSSHGVFAPSPDRPDPVTLLEDQATTRVQELVPIRYGRMLVSPFTFFRGAALIMASDLSTTPTSRLTAQICGDAHLSNFGVFGSPERRLVFDCNDFDETLPGPWEWDIKRLAASVVVAGRYKGHNKSVRTAGDVQLGQSYRESMRQMAAMTNLEVWYSHVDVSEVVAALESQAAASGSRQPLQRNRRGHFGTDRVRQLDHPVRMDHPVRRIRPQRAGVGHPVAYCEPRDPFTQRLHHPAASWPITAGRCGSLYRPVRKYTSM